MFVNLERVVIVDFDDFLIFFYDFNDYIWIKRIIILIFDFIFNIMEIMYSKRIFLIEKIF